MDAFTAIMEPSSEPPVGHHLLDALTNAQTKLAVQAIMRLSGGSAKDAMAELKRLHLDKWPAAMAEHAPLLAAQEEIPSKRSGEPAKLKVEPVRMRVEQMWQE